MPIMITGTKGGYTCITVWTTEGTSHIHLSTCGHLGNKFSGNTCEECINAKN